MSERDWEIEELLKEERETEMTNEAGAGGKPHD